MKAAGPRLAGCVVLLRHRVTRGATWRGGFVSNGQAWLGQAWLKQI